MRVRMGVASLVAAVAVAAGTPSARADVLELHGTVTWVASGRASDVAVGQPVTVVVRLERQVIYQAPFGSELEIHDYTFDPSEDFQIRVLFDGTRLAPIEVPGTSLGANTAQGYSTNLGGQAGRGDGEVKVYLNFSTNGTNDVMLDPTLELSDYQYGQFSIHEGGPMTVQGKFDWARPIRKDLELLGDATDGLATANAGIDSANNGITTALQGISSGNAGIAGLGAAVSELDNALEALSSSVAGLTTSTSGIATAVATLQTSLDAMALAQQNLRSAVSQVLANQEAILANQGAADRKLDRILKRLN